MTASGEAPIASTPAPMIACARAIALATAAAMIIHALHGASAVLLEDGPRAEYSWFTSAVRTCDVLTALFFISISWRLVAFTRLIAHSPGPALKRLAKAAWIYATVQGVVGVAQDIFRAMELHAAFELTLNLGETGPSTAEFFLEPVRLIWTIAHILCAALGAWVALTLTRAARKIDPARPDSTPH